MSGLVKRMVTSGDFIYDEYLKTVTIRSVTFTDAGEYRCDAVSIANTSNAQTVNVIGMLYIHLVSVCFGIML